MRCSVSGDYFLADGQSIVNGLLNPHQNEVLDASCVPIRSVGAFPDAPFSTCNAVVVKGRAPGKEEVAGHSPHQVTKAPQYLFLPLYGRTW